MKIAFSGPRSDIDTVHRNCTFRFFEIPACRELLRNGHAAVTKELIQARCNMDLQREDGCTALFSAAQNGHETVTEQLIAARSNVDPQLPCGATPLFIAAENGHASVTQQLIAARCNIDAQTNNGATPLVIAAQQGHATVTEHLTAGWNLENVGSNHRSGKPSRQRPDSQLVFVVIEG